MSTLLPSKTFTLLSDKDSLKSGGSFRIRKKKKPLVALKSLAGPLEGVSVDDNSAILKSNPNFKHGHKLYSSLKYANKPPSYLAPTNASSNRNGRVCPITLSPERSPARGFKQPIIFPSLIPKKEQSLLKMNNEEISFPLTTREEGGNANKENVPKLHPSGAETSRPAHPAEVTGKHIGWLQPIQTKLQQNNENLKEKEQVNANENEQAIKLKKQERNGILKKTIQAMANQDTQNQIQNTNNQVVNTTLSIQIKPPEEASAHKRTRHTSKSRKEILIPDSSSEDNAKSENTETPDSTKPDNKKPALCDEHGNMLPLTPLSIL